MCLAISLAMLPFTDLRVRADSPSPATIGHESAILGHLRPALKYVGGAARIYYAAECREAEYDTSGRLQLLFPTVYLQSPSQGAAGIDAVRQIFWGDANVAVAQDRSRMIRITIGNPSTAVLQTRIQTLTLSPNEQFGAPSAVVAIESAPELHTAERTLHAYPNLQIIDIIVAEPSPGAPHLPKSMKDVTVDEALDAVARTFKGIITYGICKRPGVVICLISTMYRACKSGSIAPANPSRPAARRRDPPIAGRRSSHPGSQMSRSLDRGFAKAQQPSGREGGAQF